MAARFNLLDFAYAHRGLWSLETHPENSLEAILAAARARLGCEFDVRPAACGTPVVFHDSPLERMTGRPGNVSDYTAAELTEIALAGGGTLPTLAAILESWPAVAQMTHRQPSLIEIKIDGKTDPATFTRAVGDLVRHYPGAAAIMSFNYEAVAAIPKDIMRGALIMPSVSAGQNDLAAQINQAMKLKPDYIACHVTDARRAYPVAAQTGMPVVVWTVASKAMASEMSQYPVAQIFEGFDPALVRP